MEPTSGSYQEIAVPVSVFAALRQELAREAGALPTIHALHAAGYAAGEEAAAAFSAEVDGDVGAIPEEAFWTRVTAFFSDRGWGTLARESLSDAVGILASEDWVESAHAAGEPHADESCSFSAGFLSGFLSRLSGGRMAVLEVSCRGRGDDRCSFAFGSESAIHELYGHILEGAELGQALARL